jgi:hypothetical protein
MVYTLHEAFVLSGICYMNTSSREAWYEKQKQILGQGEQDGSLLAANCSFILLLTPQFNMFREQKDLHLQDLLEIIQMDTEYILCAVKNQSIYEKVTWKRLSPFRAVH